MIIIKILIAQHGLLCFLFECFQVLSASRKIQFNYDDSSSNSPSYEKSKQSTRIASQDDHILLRQQSSNRSRAKSSFTTETPAYEARIQKLTVFQTRQINGCLIRAPTTFYTDIWYLSIHITLLHLKELYLIVIETLQRISEYQFFL